MAAVWQDGESGLCRVCSARAARGAPLPAALPRCPALRSPRRSEAGWLARSVQVMAPRRPAGACTATLSRELCGAARRSHAVIPRSARGGRSIGIFIYLRRYSFILDCTRRFPRPTLGWQTCATRVHAHHSAGAPPRAAGTYGRVRTPQRARTRVHLRQAVPAGPVSANSGRLVPAWCAYGGPTVKARAI